MRLTKILQAVTLGMPTNNDMSTTEEVPLEKDPLLKDADPPTNAVIAAPIKKEPPPEKPEQTRLRFSVFLSFWAIIILLGLPIWWKTTSIYRARLPMDEMMDWADGRVSSPSRIGAKLTVPGMSTSFPSSNIDRSRFPPRSRSTTSSANYSTCAG